MDLYHAHAVGNKLEVTTFELVFTEPGDHLIGDLLACGLLILEPVQKLCATIVFTQAFEFLRINAQDFCQAGTVTETKLFTEIVGWMQALVCQFGQASL